MNLEKLVGTTVLFTGFTAESDEDLPPNHEALTEGEKYTLIGFTPEDDKNEASVVLEAPNPNFDDSKRASSKANPRMVPVVLFLDEFEQVDAVEQEDEEQEEQEEQQDEEQQEVVEAEPAKKKTAAKKSTKKAAAKKKAPVKEAAPVEEQEEEEEEVAPDSKPAKKKAATKKTAKKATKKTAKQADKEEEDEDLKDLIIFDEGVEDEDIVEMVTEAQEGEGLCALAEELAEETAYSEWRLGGVLYHTRLTKAFREIKDGQYDVPGGFGEYVANELNLGYRKAMNLVQIYQEFTKHGLSGDVVSQIKWTKASIVATASSKLGDDLTEKGLNRLLTVAEDSSADDLRSTIKETYAKKGGEAGEIVRKVTFKFRLTEQEAEMTRQYLEGAKKLLNTKDDAAAFAHICAEWAGENLDAVDAGETEAVSARGVGRGAKTAEVHQEA